MSASAEREGVLRLIPPVAAEIASTGRSSSAAKALSAALVS
jgi:hypothetical protein